jgi:hypothetical protein
VQIRLDVRFCALAAAGAASTNDGLGERIAIRPRRAAESAISKWRKKEAI